MKIKTSLTRKDERSMPKIEIRPSIKDTGSNRFELIEGRSRANRFKADSPVEIVERIMSDERSEKMIHEPEIGRFTKTSYARGGKIL